MTKVFQRGKKVKVYTGFDKAQAIDGLGHFLSNSNSIYRELVMPVMSGKVSKDIQIGVIASQIKYNMMYEANTNGGKIEVVGKSKYYPVGNWTKKEASDGTVLEYLTLDLKGEDADLFDEDYLEKRIENFLNMSHEYNLLKNLKKLGYEVRASSENEDKYKKVDLILVNKYDEWLGISVYKSSDEIALSKLHKVNYGQFNHRLAYNVYKYGSPKKIENVKKWINDCNSGKNHIIIEKDGKSYIKNK